MAPLRVQVAGQHVDPTIVAQVADAIRAKRHVVLPTETVYGLAADPRDPEAAARVSRWKGRPDSQPLTHHLASREVAAELALPFSPRVKRLAERYWPGPLTLLVRARGGGTVGLRVPAQAFTRAVIAACGGDLYLTSVNRSGEPPLNDPEAILATFGDRLDVLCDAGKSRLEIASTIVNATTEEFVVLREGILSRAEVLATAARTVLFVCSGNTCRSPMAEALAQRLASARLGVPAESLLAHGVRFLSAGTATLAGMPASEAATAAVKELGADLAAHRSRPFSRELAKQANLVLCLTHGHRQRVLDLDPSLQSKTWLLDPGGEDVHDPFGADLSTYRATRDEIASMLEARWDDLEKLFRS